MRIVLSGIFYPLAILRYFERALQRREDVELVTVGPYTGNWIPWNGGMNLPMKYAITPTYTLPQQAIGMRSVSPGIVENTEAFQDIDLWIEVDAGFYFDPKPKSGIVAHVATDPHVLNYDKQRQLADYFFNMQAVYMQEGDYWLPYAYDPTVHYPEEREKAFDVCLLGLHYDQRNQLVTRLRGHGINVFYDIGHVFDDYRRIMNSSRIGLNWSSLQDLNARAFEVPAMKLCPVMNRVPDMDIFFEDGKDYLGFSTMDEAIQKTIMVVKDEEMRSEIAENAHNSVQEHTYDKRIEQILQTCGLL